MKLNRICMLAVSALAVAALACPAFAAPKTKIDVPQISCAGSGTDYIDIRVCAPNGTGATGLPAGFSIHWTTQANLDANGGVWPATDGVLACGASFSGNASDSRYVMAPGACVTVRIGDILLDNGASTNCPDHLVCGTTYVFRSFGHPTSTLKRSDFSANLQCSTLPCNIGCDPNVKSFGFWKNHNDLVCAIDPTSPLCLAWPVTTLTLGTVSYNQAELVAILNATPAGGNGLVSLAHQLINAKLNIANGASAAYVAAVSADIAAADALIGSLVIPPVGGGFLSASATSALTLSLDTTRAQYECP